MTIIWDWNGTLLDDTPACLSALNLMLSRRSLKGVTLDFYRREFSFPVKSFYGKIGIRLENEDWDSLAREYHDAYLAEKYALNAEALPALEAARMAGARQGLLSALRQDLLESAAESFGVAPYMDFIVGADNLDGGSKMGRARSLAERLGGAQDAVVIGDALHDAEVARGMGAKCVLFSGGGHSAERLSAVAPTRASLLECVRLALENVV